MIQNWEDFATLERGFRKKENGLVPISVIIGDLVRVLISVAQRARKQRA
jgi:hypothetical protein